MEKGNSKNSASSKTSCPESKYKQDVNKCFRLQRYKDCASPRPDNRVNRSNYSRNREYYDKRPRNRNAEVCEKYWGQVADGAVGDSFNQLKCKKTNLNHLLNFTLAPVDHWDGNARRPMHYRPKTPKYNKELFLQANYQFVVRDEGDYKVYLANPDILVDWSLIEEILVPCHEVPLCPICLHIPVAAKITRCGHVYCWPCMLHYLALTDKTWQKCPICFDAVHKDDLKSVSLQVRKQLTVGDDITMYLMKREKGSFLPVPVMQQKPLEPICKISSDLTVTRYQKLLLASPKDVEIIINRERSELQGAFYKEQDTPESCFIESALKLLEEREKSFTKNDDSKCNSNNDLFSLSATSSSRKHFTSISSCDSCDDSSILDIVNGSPKCSTTFRASQSSMSSMSETDIKGVSYFYQSEDGQHIYLQNINVRMLVKEFGSLEFAPPKITAKIVEIERVSMTEVLRKRLRYLLHLPLTCEFQLAELDFHQIIQETTFLLFETEVRKRKSQRNRKAREEKRREKMIEVEENKKLGKYPKATYNLNSNDQFPAYNPEDFLSLSPPKHEYNKQDALKTDEVASLNNNAMIDKHEELTEMKSEPTFASFAQMLKGGPSTFTARVKEKNAALPSSQQLEDSDVEDPSYMYHALNSHTMSFGNAIQAALDSVTIHDVQDTNQGSKKKKKKGKMQVLFTTAICRNK